MDYWQGTGIPFLRQMSSAFVDMRSVPCRPASDGSLHIHNAVFIVYPILLHQHPYSGSIPLACIFYESANRLAFYFGGRHHATSKCI